MSEKPPSDQIRKTEVEEWLRAHAHPNGNGRWWFIKSPLFASLLSIGILQAIAFGLAFATLYWRVSDLVEWKGGVDKDLETFKQQGSPALRKDMEFIKADVTFKLGKLDERTTKIEADTEHFDVMEAENRRITAELEKLKNEKK